MRNAFAAKITELAQADPRVVVLSGDIGNRLFDRFKTVCPGRFINCGVAEANMMSLAAGMAMTGLRPFVYTIAPFVTARVLEQVRVDVCFHNVPVTIVGAGAGLSYASLGPTHHSCEDLALMRCLPGMTVLSPADATEVRLALAAALTLPGPAYIRIGKKGEEIVHGVEPAFVVGKGILVRDGGDVCILATGNMVAASDKAADILAGAGVSARVVSMHTVKPLDEQLLAEAFCKFSAVAVVEEHSIIGGLTSAVAQWLALQPSAGSARLLSFSVPDEFLTLAGDQDDARGRLGLTPETIAAQLLDFRRRRP